ncbi:MAG TPA: lysylphosphatidylglycerol synthase transmembrane domain-containing protein [Burkholderiales bacterium]|nr:lysylphosphatidylglycerol synthase transmembrane domain-containing protein [Burkholderiales bacterium]
MKTLLLKLTVSVALVTTLVARADLADLGRRLASAGVLTLMIGSLCIFALSVTIAARWKTVLVEFRYPLSFSEAWRYTMIGMFFNQLLPSGMGGDGLRIWYARRAGVPLGTAVGTVVVDRVLALLGLLLLVILGLPYLFSLHVTGVLATVISISSILVALGVAVFLSADHMMAGIATLLKGRVRTEFLHRPFLIRVKGGLNQTAKDTRRLLQSLPYGPATILLSLVNQISLGLVVLYLARSMSLNLSPAAAVFLFPPVLLLSMIPISLAGWGIREGAMVVVFSVAGLNADASLSVSVLFGACMFVSGLPGGFVWLLTRHLGKGHAASIPRIIE